MRSAWVEEDGEGGAFFRLDRSPSTRRSVSAISFVIDESISERMIGSGWVGFEVGVDGAEVEEPYASPRLVRLIPSIGLWQGCGRVFHVASL